jgi:hypothetical protein
VDADYVALLARLVARPKAVQEWLDAPMSPARDLFITPGPSRLQVQWISPATDGVTLVQGYEVQTSTDQRLWRHAGSTSSRDHTKFTLTGVRCCETTYVRVRSTGGGVWSSWSTAEAVPLPPPPPPGPPRYAVLRQTNGDVVVSWSSPTPQPGVPVDQYEVQVHNGAGEWKTVAIIGETGRMVVLTGKAGAGAQARVAARNGGGLGPWTAAYAPSVAR